MKAAWLLGWVLAAAQALADPVPQTGAPADWGKPMMGDHPYGMVLIDRLEYADSDDGNSRSWDAQAWYGGDYQRIYLETEGEGATGEAVDAAEVRLLYDRLFAPFWSWRAGARYDLRPGAADVGYVSFGIQGLAPQWFETDLAAFVSEDGDVTLRGEVEYDLLFTQRLILQPRLELNVALQEVAELGIGSGLTTSEAGLRLRYEWRPEIAPYLGVSWHRAWGDTRDLARADDEPTSRTSLVLGIRAWF